MNGPIRYNDSDDRCPTCPWIPGFVSAGAAIKRGVTNLLKTSQQAKPIVRKNTSQDVVNAGVGFGIGKKSGVTADIKVSLNTELGPTASYGFTANFGKLASISQGATVHSDYTGSTRVTRGTEVKSIVPNELPKEIPIKAGGVDIGFNPVESKYLIVDALNQAKELVKATVNKIMKPDES